MTATQELATIEKVDIREIWPDEAKNFTPWLSEHMPELGEALGLDLETRTTEAPVGAFALDILAHDVGRDHPVAIENQLEVTDHSHLGQLLTYTAGYDANVVVWIAREFKEEHREALDLLNRRTDEETEFFGVVVEVWRIGESRPAPHFKVVSAPNDWRKAKVSRRAGPSERDRRCRAFFQRLLDTMREEHQFTNQRRTSATQWCSFPSDAPRGFTYNTAISFASNGKTRVELYISPGEKDWNKAAFDQLLAHKEPIESELGPLEWERLDNYKPCRASTLRRPGGVDDNEEALEEVHDWMVDRLLAFRRVFGPRLTELDVIAEPSQGGAL